ncbi:hypothetical protein [Bradyrhizobium sp. 177]|nr:hypothetical protein [Bradyrhizobium sp. 177]
MSRPDREELAREAEVMQVKQPEVSSAILVLERLFVVMRALPHH